jgi:hypothetical protein
MRYFVAFAFMSNFHLILCRCRPAGGVKPSALIGGIRWRRQALVFWLSRWTAIHRREARCLDELNLRLLNLLVNSNFEENLNYFLMAKKMKRLGFTF